MTTFEIGHETKIDNEPVKNGFGMIYKLSQQGIPVPVKHPVETFDEFKPYKPPVQKKEDLGLLDLAMDKASMEASSIMVLAIIGAPLGCFLTDLWMKKQKKVNHKYE
jgi:hypothetical protein